MDMQTVESSNVAEIGYDEALGILAVRFRSGGLYEYPGTSAETWRQLLAAPSKGHFIARLGREAKLIEKLPDYSAVSHPEAVRPIQTFQADDCCGPRLAKALDRLAGAETWVCPKCGCEWRPRQVGDVRHWEPHEIIEVFGGR